MLTPQALTQPLVLLGALGLFGWGVRKTMKKNAIEETRDGIAMQAWQDGAAKVGPLGKWQDSPVAKLQRTLDALTRVHSQRNGEEKR